MGPTALFCSIRRSRISQFMLPCFSSTVAQKATAPVEREQGELTSVPSPRSILSCPEDPGRSGMVDRPLPVNNPNPSQTFQVSQPETTIYAIEPSTRKASETARHTGPVLSIICLRKRSNTSYSPCRSIRSRGGGGARTRLGSATTREQTRFPFSLFFVPEGPGDRS